MRNYWLFQIMFDDFPGLWESSVHNGVAAQHYPKGWINVEPNTRRFKELKCGDMIIAALRNHRFAGFGELKSDFYRGGPSLEMKRISDGDKLRFGERFDCEWHVIPLQRIPPYIQCHDLKSAGFSIDLERGRAVRRIDKKTFDALRSKLVVAGARPIIRVWLVKAREVLKDGTAGWHWRHYFDGSEDGISWGGRDWIRSSASMKYLRERVREGDLIVCYQADDESHGPSIVGLTQFASAGMQDPPGSGKFNMFDLPPSSDAFPLKPPLRRDILHGTGCRPRCFAQGTQGTVFPLDNLEFAGILAAINHQSAHQSDDLRAWLDAARFDALTLVRNVAAPQDPEDVEVNRECRVEDVEGRLDELERKMATRSPTYVEQKIRQWIRNDRPFIRALKAKYNHRCQFPGCNFVIPMRNGNRYCEVAHIRAVAAGGKSVRLNLLVLCPNHHKLLDYGHLQVDVNTRHCISGKLNGLKFKIPR